MNFPKQELSQELLMEICSLVANCAEPECVEELCRVPDLIRHSGWHQDLAIASLAHVLGQIRCHNPVHLPFGFGGPSVQPWHWIDRETLGRVGKQVVGLVWEDRDPSDVSLAVETAISHATNYGFLEVRRYDAWLPGMPSGSGWRNAVRVTPYGVIKVRAAQVKASVKVASPAPESGPWYEETTSPTPTPVPTATPAPASAPVPQDLNPNDAFTWARQTDLVNAVNQVLGADMLNKGVLSRACRDGKVKTNGAPGQASRVEIQTFLVWVARQFSIDGTEQTQIRNAIIGELTSRNYQRNSAA